MKHRSWRDLMFYFKLKPMSGGHKIDLTRGDLNRIYQAKAEWVGSITINEVSIKSEVDSPNEAEESRTIRLKLRLGLVSNNLVLCYKYIFSFTLLIYLFQSKASTFNCNNTSWSYSRRLPVLGLKLRFQLKCLELPVELKNSKLFWHISPQGYSWVPLTISANLV